MHLHTVHNIALIYKNSSISHLYKLYDLLIKNKKKTLFVAINLLNFFKNVPKK